MVPRPRCKHLHPKRASPAIGRPSVASRTSHRAPTADHSMNQQGYATADRRCSAIAVRQSMMLSRVATTALPRLESIASIMGPELQASLSRVSKTALPRLENQCNESWVQNCKQASASHDVEAARAARARPVARTTLKAAKSCHI